MKNNDEGMLIAKKWRVGRKVGRTVYAQIGKTPNDGDPLIGLFDTTEFALKAIEDHNKNLK